MFKKFGTLPYSLDGYSKEAVNILTAAVVKHINVDLSYVYQRYVVPTGTSPENLAEKLYDDPNKYWTILLVNSIVNPFLEWPMDSITLEDYTRNKYGSVDKVLYFTTLPDERIIDDYDSIAFFEMLDNGDPLPQNVRPVGALEYEASLNAKRSEIVVVSPKYISIFVDAFEKTIQGIEQ